MLTIYSISDPDMNFVKRTAIIAGLVSAVVGTSAAAALMYSYDIVYYSDASMSSAVGMKYVHCSGQKVLGVGSVVTPYYQIENEAPCRHGGYPTDPDELYD